MTDCRIRESSALISCAFWAQRRFMIFAESLSITCLACRMPAPPITLEERRMHQMLIRAYMGRCDSLMSLPDGRNRRAAPFDGTGVSDAPPFLRMESVPKSESHACPCAFPCRRRRMTRGIRQPCGSPVSRWNGGLKCACRSLVVVISPSPNSSRPEDLKTVRTARPHPFRRSIPGRAG